jgi:hypothetical protein
MNEINPTREIQRLLLGIGGRRKNKTGRIFLNIIKNEFITLNDKISIPRISVKELDYPESIPIIRNIIEYIPQFLFEHSLLEKRSPSSEQHTLQFVRKMDGRVLTFIHMLKIDLKFGGDSSTVIEKGDTDHYPSYTTDRLYYKSILVPVTNLLAGESVFIEGFESLRLYDSTYVESDKNFFTSVIFEDANEAMNKNIIQKVDGGLFKISSDIYSFITGNYFTACFNVLYPVTEEIKRAVEIIEPIFIYIYSRYRDIGALCDPGEIEKTFADSVAFSGGAISLKEDFLREARDYFHRFTLYRDDDLVLKGWWRFDAEFQ